MKKLSYLFAVAASAACLCACTDVTDALPAEQIPADARSTLGADVVLQWNNEEQTIDGFGVAQAGWSDYLYAHRKRQEIMDVMFGQDGLRLSILRGEVFPHYDETTFNMDEDINLSSSDVADSPAGLSPTSSSAFFCRGDSRRASTPFF